MAKRHIVMGVLGPHGWNVRYVALTPELSEVDILK